MPDKYVHPEVLVETHWVAEHLNDPKIRLVEADEDTQLYETGHLPGAVKVEWNTSLQDPLERNILSREAFENLCGALGIANDTQVIFYGDKNNWFATYAFWIFDLYGHRRKAIMNGGRDKWVKENRPFTREVPSYPAVSYTAAQPDASLRAFREQVLLQSQGNQPLIDVRSSKEYIGELIAMPNYPQEGAQRGGHIPGAVNIPWSQAVDEQTGIFKTAENLHQIYASRGFHPDQEIITYCRIGERSSHTWFVLHYLLGYPRVKNYDGSWTEWGNLVDVPIRKGNEP